MDKYNVLFPGSFYPGTFYGNNEQEAREAARRWLGTTRLPKGTEVWAITQTQIDTLNKSANDMREVYGYWDS